jgi:hypothetical protein
VWAVRIESNEGGAACEPLARQLKPIHVIARPQAVATQERK